MTDAQETALDNLRSGNMALSELMKSTIELTLKKNKDLVGDSDNVNDLLSAIKVVETASKIVGLSPKETQTNISLNAVVGFDFIEVDEDDIKQLTTEETYEEAEYED